MSSEEKPAVRDRQLNISLSFGELEDVKALSDAAGMKPIDYGRAKVLADRARAPAARHGSATLRLVYERLSRIGATLNQMLRHAQTTREPLKPKVEPFLEEIRQILRERSGDDR